MNISSKLVLQSGFATRQSKECIIEKRRKGRWFIAINIALMLYGALADAQQQAKVQDWLALGPFRRSRQRVRSISARDPCTRPC